MLHPTSTGGGGVGALARAATRTILVGGVYAGAMAALETVLPGHGHEGAGALAATLGTASTAVLHKVDHLLGHLFGHQLVSAVFPHESGPPTRSGLNHDIEHTFATAAAQAVVALMGEWEKKIPASQRAIDSGQWERDDFRTACTPFLAGGPGAEIPEPIAAWLTALGDCDILEHGGLATAPDTAAMPAHPCSFYAYFDWRFSALFQHLFTEELLTHAPARHKFALLIQRHVIARLDQLADGMVGLKTQLTALAQRVQPGDPQWDASFTAQLGTILADVRALSVQQAARFDHLDAQLDRIAKATAPLPRALHAIREFLTTSGQSAGQWIAVQREVRGSRQTILAVLAGGLLLLGGIGWLVKKDAARTEEKMDVLLAVSRELVSTLGRQRRSQNPQDAAARLAAAYVELEAQHHLPPGTLAKELPKFAEQLLQRSDTSALDRANALFVTKKFAECETAALQAKDQAVAAAGKPLRDAIAALELAGSAAREQIHYPPKPSTTIAPQPLSPMKSATQSNGIACSPGLPMFY